MTITTTMKWSDKIDQISAKLLEVQKRSPAIPKAERGGFGKYASLPTIKKLVDPILLEAGLLFTHGAAYVADGTNPPQPVMVSRLTDVESGQWIEAATPMILDKTTMQGLGSAQSYSIRYNYGAMLNLDIGGDDDGASANRGTTTRRPAPAATGNSGNSGNGSWASTTQNRSKILNTIKTGLEVGDIAEVMRFAGIQFDPKKKDWVVEAWEQVGKKYQTGKAFYAAVKAGQEKDA